MAIVAVSITPIGSGDASVSRYVAAAQRVLEEDGRVRYRLDPMFTTIEGELGTIFEIIEKMHEAVLACGAVRVSAVIKVDVRIDKEVKMEDKVASVQRQLIGSG